MSDQRPYQSANWTAIRAGGDLLVFAGCTFPTPGWTAELRHGNPGINPDPKTLVLALVVTEPTGPVPRVPTSALVTLQAAARELERVTVHEPGDLQLRNIDVRDVAP